MANVLGCKHINKTETTTKEEASRGETSWVCNDCGDKWIVNKSGWWRFIETKPPLGVMPKYLHDGKRLHELERAISEYLTARMKINVEWVEEYNSLIEELK